MRTLSIIAVILFCACTQPKQHTGEVIIYDTVHTDTVKHKLLYDTATLPPFYNQKLKIDSMQHAIDSLSTELFIANFKISRVKYYMDIVNRKPSQRKFLRSWINRAIQ